MQSDLKLKSDVRLTTQCNRSIALIYNIWWNYSTLTTYCTQPTSWFEKVNAARSYVKHLVHYALSNDSCQTIYKYCTIVNMVLFSKIIEKEEQKTAHQNVFFENSELDSLAKHFINMHRYVIVIILNYIVLYSHYIT